MNTRSVSTVSVAVLFALTATASAGPMSITNSKQIAPSQIRTEPVQYRYYGGYGYGGYGGWNSGAALAGAALGLLSVGALAATEVTATPITARLRITAGRMVITGGLMPATRTIVITGLTTSQTIGVTRITGGKTIANMATGRTGSMRTGAAFIRDAASGIARRNVDTTGNRTSLSME